MSNKTKFTLQELAHLTQSRLEGNQDLLISGVADLESATPSDASFLSHPRYTTTRYSKLVETTKAGVIFISPNSRRVKGKNYLLNKDPSRAFQIAIEKLKKFTLQVTGFTGIHPSAVIHPSASIAHNVTIGPNSVIDQEVTIKEHTQILANVTIGPATHIGSHCLIHANVVIRENTKIGNRVILQPGAVIGGCGFGYSTDDTGAQQKIAHVGNVVLEDDVEIGANATIDRARFTSTVIGKGSKVDNLVVIAHNVQVGPNNLIAGQSGIAGSTKTGNRVVIGGQSGIDGHLRLGNDILITARSGVSKPLKIPGKYGGIPAIPLSQHNRLVVWQSRVSKLAERVAELEKKGKC